MILSYHGNSGVWRELVLSDEAARILVSGSQRLHRSGASLLLSLVLHSPLLRVSALAADVSLFPEEFISLLMASPVFGSSNTWSFSFGKVL